MTDLTKLLDNAARLVRRRSLVVLISDFISEPGWERSLLRLTERHEVVAVRLVDPREYELPDAGLLVVQDAETGEQLVVDSSDPELRRRLLAAAEEQDWAIRRAVARAGVNLHVVSTEEDLVSAFVRMAGAAPEAPPMTFRSPGMLAALLLIPVLVAAYVSTRRRRARRAEALAAPGPRHHRCQEAAVAPPRALRPVRRRPGRPGRRPGPTDGDGQDCPGAKPRSSWPSTCPTAWRPPTSSPPASRRRRRPRGAFIRRQPPAVRIGVVAFGPGAVIVQPPTLAHADALKAVDRLSLGGGTSVGQGLLTSLDAIAGKTLTIDVAALSSDSGKVDIGYYGASTIVLLSDGEETSGPDPVALAGVASVAGVHVQTIGIGTAAGTTVQINGFSVATALDSDLLQKVASVTDGSYHQANDAAGLTAISKTIDLRFKVVTEHTEITAVFAAAAVLLLAPARCSRCCGSAGWCEMSFTWPLALLLLLVVPLVLGVYLWSMRRRRRQAVTYSSLALLRTALPRRSRWRRHVPVGAAARPASACWRWRRPGPRSRPTCRSGGRRSSSPSTCPARCARQTYSRTD